MSETPISPEVKELIKGVKSSVKSWEEKIQSKADGEHIEGMQKAIDSLKEEIKSAAANAELDQVKSKLDDIAAKMKANQEMPEKPLPVMEQVKKQLSENVENLKDISNGAQKSVKLNLKVDSSDIGDRVVFGLREQGIAIPQRPRPSILDVIPIVFGGVASNPLSWVERNIVSGASAPVAELAVKPTREIEWVENKVVSETIAVHTPVSRKALLNLPLVEQEIRSDHNEDIRIKLEEQIYRGTGTSPDLNGLITVYATPYSSGALSNTVTSPDNQAVARALQAQFERANFMGDTLMVNPDDFAAMDLSQDNDADWRQAPFRTGIDQVAGMRVISTNLINADEFLAIDSTRPLLNFVEDVRTDIGWINEQFITNQITIRTELDAAHRVKENHRPAIITGTFSAAIADLTKV